MSKKKRAINAIVSCFADEKPSWNSIALITPNNDRHKAIVDKLSHSFGADDRNSQLYIDAQTHQHMFHILLNCMNELDSCVKNHSYDRVKRDTKNIKFVRDIVRREFDIDGQPDKFDQRLILFETACVVLLSMNNDILSRNNETFPKYENIESFLAQPCYDDFKNLSYGENNEYYYFANYINVALNFVRGTYNQKHLIQIGLRIAAGRGERFITGKGMTDKNKRRVKILESEANEPGVVTTFKDSFKPYFNGSSNDFKQFAGDFEAQIGVELPNVKSKEHSRNIAGVDIVTNVYEKSTSDEKINITIHETRADNTTLSRSASLVERLDNEDENFMREIEEVMRLLDLEEQLSISTNVSRSNNLIVKTTTVNVRNNPEQNTSPRSMSNAGDEFPKLLRSTSQSTEEYDLLRSTSNANDLLVNHLNMASLTDELISFNSFRDIFSFDSLHNADMTMDADLATQEILQNDSD